MKKTFLLPIALALRPSSCCRCRALGAPVRRGSRRSAPQIEEKKQQEGVLTTTIQRFGTRIDARPGRDLRHPGAPRPRAGEPRRPEGRAARGARPAGGGPRPARAAALRARDRAQGARRPAGRDLQGRRARRAHGRARGRRLRRPARARRVPRPHLRPGPRDHRPRAPPARPAPRTRRRSSPSSSEREQLAAERILRWRDQIAAVAGTARGLARRAGASRARTSAARSARCASSRGALEGDLRRARGGAGRVSRPRSPGRRRRGRSGRAAAR